jgi:hypothetical protein
VIAALRGVGRLGYKDATTKPPSKEEESLAFLLLHVWFAALVGWSAKLASQNEVVDQTRLAAELLIKGMDL